MPAMHIVLNGQPHALAAPSSIADLLLALGLAQRPVAVEVNLEVVPRSRHADTWLKEQDRVEIVRALGGG
jgi:sulfur carrier protein